jgi:TonB family protein
MKIGWQSAIAVFLSAFVFGGTELEKPRTTRILIHEHLSEACELVQSGQLLQYRDYSAVVVDGIPGELYSLELAPSSFIEAANGAGRGIKSASKAGFVVKGSDVSIPSDLPRVVALVTGAECPPVQDAVTLAAKQRDSRRASIQAKLYRPGLDDVTRPMPEASPQKSDTHPAMNANATPPSGKPKVMHGTVVLAVAIGPDGAVRDAKLVRSLDPWLDVKAMEEVRTWRFQPARKQGLPVAAVINVEVNFNLH